MITSTHCRYVRIAELPVRDADAANRWLSEPERRTWQRIRSSERRATWIAGRILAKRLIKECRVDVDADRELPADRIHIQSRSEDEVLGQRPCVFVDDKSLNWSVSIAHTQRGVLAAISTEPDMTVGVDLVLTDDCRPEKLDWCFTTDERRWAAGRIDRAAQLWAMKEALFKAGICGDGFSPGKIEVFPMDDGVRHLQSWRIDGHIAALAILGSAASNCMDQAAETAAAT